MLIFWFIQTFKKLFGCFFSFLNLGLIFKPYLFVKVKTIWHLIFLDNYGIMPCKICHICTNWIKICIQLIWSNYYIKHLTQNQYILIKLIFLKIVQISTCFWNKFCVKIELKFLHLTSHQILYKNCILRISKIFFYFITLILHYFYSL